MGGFHAYVNANTYTSLSSSSETLSGPLSLSSGAHSQCSATHSAGPFLSFNKLKKTPNSINKKLLKYEPTNHNSFRLSSLSKNYLHVYPTFSKDWRNRRVSPEHSAYQWWQASVDKQILVMQLNIPCAPGMSTSYHLWLSSITWVPLLT